MGELTQKWVIAVVESVQPGDYMQFRLLSGKETYCCSAIFDWLDVCSGNQCALAATRIFSECEMVSLCQYCSKVSCRDCPNCGSGDVESCACHSKIICSECLARQEDHNLLCVRCVKRADRYLDGCLCSGEG
jgi:hypothetical protein